MSILIKGMEMPKSCNTCELASIEDISDGLAYGCNALKEMIPNDKERLPNCPLIPVPPHVINFDKPYSFTISWDGEQLKGNINGTAI